MNQLRKQRLLTIITLLLGAMAVVFLLLFALSQNINLYYTPSQLVSGNVTKNTTFRIGGLVKPGTVKHSDGLSVNFVLTDTANEVAVSFTGLLPDLFREGQGIVAQGKLDEHGVIIASEVLAKHDSNYMPPSVKAAIADAKGVSNGS